MLKAATKQKGKKRKTKADLLLENELLKQQLAKKESSNNHAIPEPPAAAAAASAPAVGASQARMLPLFQALAGDAPAFPMDVDNMPPLEPSGMPHNITIKKEAEESAEGSLPKKQKMGAVTPK